jgi:hypothetical protein
MQLIKYISNLISTSLLVIGDLCQQHIVLEGLYAPVGINHKMESLILIQHEQRFASRAALHPITWRISCLTFA